jgi:beta-lactamase class A
LTSHLNRRAALGLGATAAAGIALGTTAVASAEEPPKTGAGAPTPTTALAACDPIKKAYERETRRAAGTWNSFITVADASGALVTAVEDKADEVVQAYSVNKIAVATAVLHRIDKGEVEGLTLHKRVEVTKEIIIPDGDGIFRLDSAYPSSVTLGHVLANLLSVSDDTAVRLCGEVCPAQRLNEILVEKGFPKTQVTPVANPNRFFLGKTTPRETHNLLQALVKGTLLSPESTAFILNVLRSPVAFTDGIRRTMSSDERGRIATKAGWFADGRNEAGIIFDKAGRPVLTYSMFARGQAQPNDFGATHPAVQARAAMGRKFLDAVDRLPGVTALRRPVPKYQPSDGG